MSDGIRCAIYARYSTNDQKEASIEDQIRTCRDEAVAKGWEILEEHIYFDKAQSGRTVRRDSFKEMMRIAMSDGSPFQRILVDDTSRMARNTKEALNIFSLLTFYGVHVYYVAQSIDTSHETAEEMITINGLIDSMYIRNLSKETRRGIVGRILAGYSGGGRRYGYYSKPDFNGKVDIYGNPEADGYLMMIKPDEADTIVRIFKLFGREGWSAKKIVNMLNREINETGGPEPPRGKYWCVSTLLGSKKAFRGILNNEIYIGRYYWNRTAAKHNPESGKKKCFTKEQDKWVMCHRPELRIVSDELWNKVKERQKQLSPLTHGKLAKAKIAYSTNLVTGLVTCGRCGSNVVIVSGGKWAKYGCSDNWNKGAAVCSNDIKIKKAELEDIIVNSLNLSFDNDALDYLTRQVDEIFKKRSDQNNQQWRGKAYEEQLKKLDKEIANFITAIKAGIISETVKNQLKKAEKKKSEVETILAEIREETIPVTIISNTVISRYLMNIRETLSINPAQGKTFLSKMVEKIVLYPNENESTIDICYKEGVKDRRPVSQCEISGRSLKIPATVAEPATLACFNA